MGFLSKLLKKFLGILSNRINIIGHLLIFCVVLCLSSSLSKQIIKKTLPKLVSEDGSNIYKQQIHVRSLFWPHTWTSITRDGGKLFLWVQF
jgi:hypothetical protein